MTRLARFAWAVLAYNLAVIAWGAYVRATGSGAGCGAHWPLCNGEILPRGARVATLIEFSHRFTSGIALLSVLALLAWTWRACRPGHPARAGAALAMFFMLTEAGVGAGLVLFQLVADNASFARAMFLSVHLINTFTLLAFLALTGWWLSGGAPLSLEGRGGRATALAALCLGVLMVATSGAVAALGDTLFPVSSLTSALWADLSVTSHVLIRLRILHPVLAALTAIAVVLGARRIAAGSGRTAQRIAGAVTSLTFTQVVLGMLNVFLLAPVWMQLLHLLAADLVWIALILLAASVLARPASLLAADAPSSPVPGNPTAVSRAS